MPWKSALRKREFSEMRLDIFAAGVYSECYVVFADNTSLWWLKLLKPGFRHCYVILRFIKPEDGWNLIRCPISFWLRFMIIRPILIFPVISAPGAMSDSAG